MALITCPECRRFISETAGSCPQCGCQLTPEKIAEMKKQVSELQDKNRQFCRKCFKIIGCIFAFIIFIIIIVANSETPDVETIPSGGGYQILEDSIGCTDKEYFNKMAGYAVEKDYGAFKKALAMGTLAGICTTFKKGETVYLTETAMFTGLIKLRRKGEVEDYWTN